MFPKVWHHGVPQRIENYVQSLAAGMLRRRNEVTVASDKNDSIDELLLRQQRDVDAYLEVDDLLPRVILEIGVRQFTPRPIATEKRSKHTGRQYPLCVSLIEVPEPKRNLSKATQLLVKSVSE